MIARGVRRSRAPRHARATGIGLVAAVVLVASCSQGEPWRDAPVAPASIDAAAAQAPRAAKLELDLSSGAAVFHRRGEPWSLALSAGSLACGRTETSIEHAGPLPSNDGGRSGYRARAGATPVDEWYAPAARGWEQGFTIGASPCAGDDADLSIVIRADGMSPVARPGGASLDLVDARHVPRLAYGDLVTRDATGRELRSSMGVAAGAIVLRVDTRRARFPVTIDPLIWVEAKKLVANDGGGGDAFGYSIGFDGTTAIFGASGATIGTNAGQGAAYVFTRSAGLWTQQQKVAAPDGTSGARFGSAVALSGTSLVVGAPVGGAPVAGVPQGTAYVFVESGGTWSLQQELKAGDFGLDGGTPDAGPVLPMFGTSVALDGDVAIVGAPGGVVAGDPQGAAYVYARVGTTWTPVTQLVASDGVANDEFGISVALSGSTAIVGAYGVMTGRGAEYVFDSTVGTWTQRQKLLASDGKARDGFGFSSVLSGTTAVVGATDHAVGSNSTQGVAYVFTQSGGMLTQQQELAASNGAAFDQFGYALAMIPGTLVVGAQSALSTKGAAWVFTSSGGTWTQQAMLTASDGGQNDVFGTALAISGNTVLCGANGATVGANSGQGAVYVDEDLATVSTTCTQDADCVSGHCADHVCCDGACTGQCEACDVPGSAGKCSPVPAKGAPHGSRPACTGTGTTCGGTCDGTTRDACGDYPTSTVSCGSTCTGATETASACDGAGHCQTQAAQPCPGGFTCDGTTCAAQCTSDSQCTTQFTCASDHTCHPRTGSSCRDANTAQDPSGHLTACGLYLCEQGQCRTDCDSVHDCAAPYVCGVTHQCVAWQGSGSTAGCSTAAGDRDDDAPWGALAGLGLVLCARAARRRRRTTGRSGS